jgi:NADPH2:quinone reductase
MLSARYEKEGKAADVLIVEDVLAPEVGPQQVLVRMTMSGINPSDVKTRLGKTSRPIGGFQIPHMDGVGEIVAVGAEVDPARTGETVWLYLAALGSRWGTAAEYAVVDQTLAVRLPDGASPELGACLGIPALTAHECLFHAGPLDGRRVLVHGGTGAVGHYAIQLARWAGATVVASTSTEQKAEQARAAGASLVVDYRSLEAATQILNDGPVDAIVDVSLVDNWSLDMAVLAPGGSIACYATDGRPLELVLRQAMSKGLRLKFFLLYTHPRDALSRAAGRLNSAIGAGALTALPITSYSLAEVVAAHENVEAGQPGKVVLDLRRDG